MIVIGYTDIDGVRRTVKGFTDKTETERLAAKLEHEVMMRKRGLIAPALEQAAKQRAGLLETHMNDFEKSLLRNGDNTAKHVQLTMTRVRAIVEKANLITASDIEPERVEAAIQAIQKKKKFGNKTYNHYIQAIGSFCNWMVPKRMAHNPLVGIAKMNEEVDIRHKRRAISIEEVQKLVKSARDSGIEIQKFDGEQRARIYIIAYMTGLRRKELSTLTPRSFDLKADPATLTVEAQTSKHRKKDVLPLHPDLVAMLTVWLPEYVPGEKLFPKLEKKKAWFMVKKDLERIGIPYENEDGIADFHATGRHTYITGLLTNGTSVVDAMKLARHSDVRTTMRYTHIGLEMQADAIKNLPWHNGTSKPKDGHEDSSGNDTVDQPDDGVRGSNSCNGENGAQHSSSESGGLACQSVAVDGTGYAAQDDEYRNIKPCHDRVCRDKALIDSDCQERRTRGSNPQPLRAIDFESTC
jgi:integrase